MARPRPITRDEAAVMVALLAGAADGEPQPEEEKVILDRLGRQLDRLGQGGQAKAARLLHELLAAIGLQRTMTSLRAALFVPQDRMDAVADAIAVVSADGRLAQAEVERIAAIANGLGLSETELESVLARSSQPGTAHKR